MNHKIICQPNFYQPHNVDINLLRAESKAEKNHLAETEAQVIKETAIILASKDLGHDVLPLFHPPLDDLTRELSLLRNKYLFCKFDRFLDSKPEKWINVRLYSEVKLNERKPKPRRMKLNGSFYDVDNKLAPAPLKTHTNFGERKVEPFRKLTPISVPRKKPHCTVLYRRKNCKCIC